MTEAQRAWYIANRERVLEKSRARYAANREQVLENTREYYAQNCKKAREQRREYYAQNREAWRQRYRENREEKLERDRLRRQQNLEAYRERGRERYARNRDKILARARTARLWADHGLRPEQWIALWDAQGGLCYLCGNEMTEDAVIDHDHSCCPQNKSCRTCRRGLAHSQCNSSIGMAKDDPDQLRNMADALQAAKEAFESRRTNAHEQLPLIE